MNERIQIIKNDKGEDAYAVVPIERWRALVAARQDAEDAAAIARARGEDEERLPATMVKRLIAGRVHPITVWREHRGLRAAALAKAAGVSPGYLSDVEKGKKDGSIRLYRKLAAALEVSIDDLDRGEQA